MSMEVLREHVKAAQIGGSLSPEATENLLCWLREGYEPFHAELRSLIEEEQWKELEDAFYTIIPFGTGGRRGPRGLGTNRLNLRTVGESAQGLAAYMLAQGGDRAQQGVVIAHDTRHMSPEFAQECACILAANGVKTMLFDDFRSTPELSFAIRHLQAAAGIMISASHNPPQDNGIKVSWRDGGQVLPPHDKGIIAAVGAVEAIHRMDLDEAKEKGLVKLIGEEVDKAYLEANVGLSRSTAGKARFTFTPLHGVGATNVLALLRHLGYQVDVVEKQMHPDGDFSHVANRSPNPEYPEAMAQVIELAEEKGAAVAMASDPDADRLGAAIPVPEWASESGWLPLTGNQIGMLAAAHLLAKRKFMSELPKGGLLVKTCVTTEFLTSIGQVYNLEVVGDLLVGFKYIAEVIENLDNPDRFVFGMEESHGYLAGQWVRDKDAAHAAVLLAELADDLANEGKTVFGFLMGLYREHGIFLEHTESVYHRGKEGQAIIARMLETLRSKPPASFAGEKVHRVIDRQQGEAFDPANVSERSEYQGAKGNVIVLELSENGWNRLTIRPSGTEPKIKVYAQMHSPVAEGSYDQQIFEALQHAKTTAKERISKLLEAVS